MVQGILNILLILQCKYLMTKQQEGLDFSNLNLDNIADSSASSEGKDSDKLQGSVIDASDVKSLQVELDKARSSLEVNQKAMEESNAVLMNAEEELVNARAVNRDEISSRLEEIKLGIEAKEHQISLLDKQWYEVHGDLDRAQQHRNSIREENYNYTEWDYPFVNRLDGSTWYNWSDGPNYTVRITLHREWGHHHLHHWHAYNYIQQKGGGNGGGWTRLWNEGKRHRTDFIGTHHHWDKGIYNDHIRETDGNLHKVKVHIDEMRSELNRLREEVRGQRGEKIEFEKQLQKIEEVLKVAKMEKEKTEIKLQEVLQEKESLEAKCAELCELIVKEESRIAEEALKLEDIDQIKLTQNAKASLVEEVQSTEQDGLVKLAQVLQEAMDLVSSNGDTKDNIQNLIKALDDLDDMDKDGDFSDLIYEGANLKSQFDTKITPPNEAHSAIGEVQETCAIEYAQ